jgi:RNA polymerase sigma-70 factor (ECF subfamily)
MNPERLPTPEELERALATLGEVEREVFLAHRLDGLGYDAIAAATGLTTGEVERHIANAMLKLADVLDGRCGP